MSSNEQEIFTCHKCHRIFKFMLVLEHHVKTEHKDIPEVMPDEKNILKKERVSIEDFIEYLEMPDQSCNKENFMKITIYDVNKLRKQRISNQFVKIMSLSDSKFKCNNCDFTAKENANVKRHWMGQHSSMKFYCDQCDYNTNYESELKVHKQTSHGGLKFSCDLCSHQSAQKKNLNQHIQFVHQKKSRDFFSCSYCEYRANRKRSVSLHVLKNHRQNKKFQ